MTRATIRRLNAAAAKEASGTDTNAGGTMNAQDWYEAYRPELVEAVEPIRAAQDEEALAQLLDGIRERAGSHLATLVDANLDDEQVERQVVVAAEAWASAASYAISRFYLDGPESLLKKGGFSEGVTDRLHELVGTLSKPLRTAVRSTGASQFSIATGFPLGVSVGLAWDVNHDEARERPQ